VAFAIRDPQKFEAPVVVYKGRAQPDEVRRAVREYAGPIADPAKVIPVEEIPAADRRELRRLLKAYVNTGSAPRVDRWIEEVAKVARGGA
jgi:acyl-coenzyme A synthetase/AMP-(fatty) acid ligase